MRTWVLRIIFLCCFVAYLGSAVKLLARVNPFTVQSLLGAANPVRVAYERYLTQFNDEKSAFVLARNPGRAFTDREIKNLSEQLERIIKGSPGSWGVYRVSGPQNAEYFKYQGNRFELVPFIQAHDGGWSMTREATERLQSELWTNNLIKADHHAFLMEFAFSQRFNRDSEAPFIRKLGQEFKAVEAANPGLELHMLGAKVASAAFYDEMGFHMGVITPALLLAMGIFLFWLYRSFQTVLWNFFVMLLCYVSTLIFIIFIEGGMGPYSSFALMFAFVVATTDLIHFFCRFQQIEGTVDERLRKTRELAFVPCFLTSATTAAGFISLIVNEDLPIRYFGVYCAFASLLEWAVIFYLLPPLLKLFNYQAPVRSAQTVARVDGYVISYWRVLSRHAGKVAWASLACLMISIVFSTRMKIDDNFYTKFVASHPLSRAVEAFSKDFEFVGSIDILLKPKSGSVLSPENVARVREIEKTISAHPLISRLNSSRIILDDLDHAIQAGRREPASSSIQPIHDSLTGLIDDYGSLSDFYREPSNVFRTVVFLRSLSTHDFDTVQDFLQGLNARFGDQIEIVPSGFSVIRSYINSNVIRDLFEAFFLSFFLTYLCYVALYRDLKWAFLALLPNMLPLLATTGLMGLAHLPVDSNLVVMICVAFGISGDNTIHLTYVLRGNLAKGLSYRDSLKGALNFIGIAMFATSAVFLFCLPVFLLGHLKIFNYIAICLSLAFLVAFFADIVLFPALQILLRKDARVETPTVLPNRST